MKYDSYIWREKNTHETGRLTLRQMFSTAWFKILLTDQQYIV